MVATLAVPTLIGAARRIGVELHKVNSGGNLYVWHTPPPEEAVVYIGKSASDKRLNEERGWRDGLDPKAEIVIGIVTLLRVNRAVPQHLHYDPDTFDTSKWRNLQDTDSWWGPGPDNLDKALPPGAKLSEEQVEQLLVRIAVRYGVPIGNSQFASQWEGPLGSVPDTLAAMAVFYDSSFVIPASHPDAERTENPRADLPNN
jgi:hypothetical protein